MIEVQQLTRRYGKRIAVDGVSFVATPGRVTGFLGPNGAGKSTTMRMIAGLTRPSGGQVLIAGREQGGRRPRGRALPPLRALGALLDPAAVDAGRSGADHLRWLAHSNGLDPGRVDETLGLVGLDRAGNGRVGTYSLGMRQRLGIATALLGDPPVLLFDEPVNGLDPDGILWFRHLCRRLAAEGRTVFLSSHLMAEVALTADHLVVIDAGRIVADAPVAEIMAAHGGHRVHVATESPADLAGELRSLGAHVGAADGARLEVRGLDAASIGRAAARLGAVVLELTPVETSLEEAFFGLTAAPPHPASPLPSHALTGDPT